MIKVGTKINNFALFNQDGNIINLNDFNHQKKVIYFYPKDNTPGCTRQACSFSNVYHQYRDLNVEVIGISKDSVVSHQKFAIKNNLPFILLSDPNLEVIKIFDVYQEKMLYGKKSWGVVRSSFVLDEDNTVIKVFPKANPDKNAEEIIHYLKNLSNEKT